MDVKKKLLFILPTLNIGGAEKVTINIIKNLDKNIFDITLVVINSKYKNLEVFLPQNISLKYLNIDKTRDSFFAIFKQIRILKPDIVFSSLNRTNILILIIKFIYPFFRVVLREPSMPSVQLKNNYMSKTVLYFIKFLYPKASNIIAQTKYMKNEIETIFNIKSSKVVVMNNPLDKDSIKDSIRNIVNPFENNINNFVYVGRLSDEKNPLFLIEIWKKVIDQNSNFKLYIIGNGNLEDQIIKKINQYKLENNIYLLGFKSNPYPYIKYANGLLLCSKWEGMPNVVIEALYLKTIVITTNSTPILKDLIMDGKNGYIVDDFNIDLFSEYILNYKIISNEFKNIKNSDFNKLFLENS